MADELLPRGWRAGQLSYWDALYKELSRQYPDWEFWKVLQSRYPEGIGDIERQKTYIVRFLTDLYRQYQNGTFTKKVAEPGTQAASTTTGEVSQEYGGYPAWMWAQGIPQFNAEQQQWQQQFAWQKEQTQAGLAMQQTEAQNQTNQLAQGRWADTMNFETQRIGAQNLGREDEIRRQEQERMFKEFENMRSQIGSSLAPKDWVIKEKAMRAANPFAPQGTQAQFQEDVDIAKDRLQTYEKMKKESGNEVKDAARQLQEITKVYLSNPSEQAYQIGMDAARRQFEEKVEFAKVRSEALQWKIDATKSWLGQSPSTEEGMAQEQWSQPRATGVGQSEVGMPNPVEWQPKATKPGIPAEMARAFSGIKEFGQFERPSGQQWMQAPWTAQQQMMGYGESLGMNWQDVEKQMALEKPQNPTLGSRWMAARQRTSI